MTDGGQLTEAYIQFTADTVKADQAIEGFKAKLGSIKPHFDAISSLGRKVFLGIAGLAAIAVNAFADAEEQDNKLRAALRSSFEQTNANTDAIKRYSAALGNVKDRHISIVTNNSSTTSNTVKSPVDNKIDKQVDEATARLDKFAKALQLITVYDDDAIKGTMALAANMGVLSDDLEGVTKVGVGLATKFFGGDLQAGMSAAAKAYNGNFRELQRLIPGLKDAGSAQEKWNMITVQGLSGFAQAQERTRTFTSQLKQLWGQVGNVAENFGEHLTPQLKVATQFFTALAVKMQQLKPEQTEQILKWVKIGAAIAAVIGFGPYVFKFLSTSISLGLTLAKTFFSLSTAMIAGLFTPVGLIVAGFAALATGFAYLIGSGDTFVSRTANGFVKIAGFLDSLLGSWDGFKQGMSLIWNQITSGIVIGWFNVQNYLLNAWEYLAEFMESTMSTAITNIGQSWDYLKTGAMKFINWLKSAWDNMIDYIANKMARVKIDIDFVDTEAGIRKLYQRKVDSGQMTQAQVDEKVEQARQQAYDDFEKHRNTTGANKSKQYDDAQAKLEAEYQQRRSDREKALQDQIANDRAKRAKNRADNDKRGDDLLAAAEDQRRKQLIADLAALEALPKLSDKFKAQLKALEEKLGLAEGIQQFDSLKDEIEKLKEEARKMANDAKVPDYKKHIGMGEGLKGGSIGSQSIEEAFKENLRRRATIGLVINQEEKRKQAEKDSISRLNSEQRKQLIQQGKLQVGAMEALTKELKTLHDLKGVFI